MDAIKQAIDAGNISPEIGGPLADMVRAYITAALWSSTIETENRESPDYDKSFLDAGYSVDSLGFGELSAAIRDCLAFQKAAGDMLTGWTMEQTGHDLWLTRCGHGAGFWDRGLPYGDELAALVGFGTLFPSLDLYLGDADLSDEARVYGFK